MAPERGPLALLLTHSDDYYCIDRVQAGLAARGRRSLRIDTDRVPAEDALSFRFGDRTAMRYRTVHGLIELDEVEAVWARRMWPGRLPAEMAPQHAAHARRQARAAFFDGLPLVPARWVNDLEAGTRAESKLLQLSCAARVGLRLPPTLVSNDPDEVRAFYADQGGAVVTKLLVPLSQTMRGTGDFVYTSPVTDDDMAAIDEVRWAPQIFQQTVQKRRELRVIVVGDRLFTGAVDAQGVAAARTDWRRLTKRDGVRWVEAALPPAARGPLLRLMRELGLVFGAADFIETPDGDLVFLEVNPAGEWGWLELELGLPIGDAIAAALCGDEADPGPRDQEDNA